MIFTCLFNGKEKKLWIEFKNPLERFIFKTIAFNRMVFLLYNFLIKNLKKAKKEIPKENRRKQNKFKYKYNNMECWRNYFP